MHILLYFVILLFGSRHFQSAARTNRTMTTAKHKTESVHVFHSKEFGDVELILDLQRSWDIKGVLYGEWIPQLYFQRGDLIAPFDGVGDDRQAHMTIKQEQRQWRRDCVRESNLWQQEAWEPMWLRSRNAKGNIQRGRIWFNDIYGRKFCVYHIGPLAESSTGKSFADGSQYPMIQLMVIEKVEIARDLGANDSLKENGIFKTDYCEVSRLPRLHSICEPHVSINI